MNYTDHTTAVTTRLVDMIRTGSHGQWSMPWHTRGTAGLFNTRNAITGTPYTGANTVALFLDALERGFPTADYATFNQYRKSGAQVRRGERAAYVIKWVTPNSRTDTEPAADHTASGIVERRLVPKVYAVFNAHQVDGHQPQPAPATDTPADEWLAAIGADVVYGGDRAYYAPTADRIYLPHPDQFHDAEAFLATSLHDPPSTGPATAPASTGSTSPPHSEAPSTPPRNSSPSSAPPSPPPASGSPPSRETTTPPISPTGSTYSARTPKILFRTAAAAQRAVDHLDTLATATTGTDEAAA